MLASILGASVLFVLSKFLPLFVAHTVYYCQHIVGFFSMEFPQQISLMIIGFFSLMFIIAIVKLFQMFIEVHFLKRKLVRYSNNKYHLKSLLVKHKMQDLVFVIEGERAFAFCFGLFYPKVYISTKLLSLLDERETEAVLLHEKCHLNNKDSLIMLLATILQHLFPFFPVLSDLLRNYKIGREIDADNEAIAILGNTQPVSSVLKKLLCVPTVTVATASAIADYESLRPRIKAIIGEKYTYNRYSKWKIITSLLAVLVLISMIVVPVHAMEIHNHQQDVMMVCLQGEGCVTSCTSKNAVRPYQVHYSSDYASHPYSTAQ